ncbi:hypothetical protein BJ508DRAFT_31738 [Ascobolus immersus RN42]|uniref:Uncharacterized protein n=1 Tax=Ascobolus immersus RN42 TaxID=1160509 RepID=A0A3N4IEH4_ASCIM|nr:hypothetical protein BJ508DRAFT_31738 [Ascobolus immersus RN42]
MQQRRKRMEGPKQPALSPTRDLKQITPLKDNHLRADGSSKSKLKRLLTSRTARKKLTNKVQNFFRNHLSRIIGRTASQESSPTKGYSQSTIPQSYPPLYYSPENSQSDWSDLSQEYSPFEKDKNSKNPSSASVETYTANMADSTRHRKRELFRTTLSRHRKEKGATSYDFDALDLEIPTNDKKRPASSEGYHSRQTSDPTLGSRSQSALGSNPTYRGGDFLRSRTGRSGTGSTLFSRRRNRHLSEPIEETDIFTTIAEEQSSNGSGIKSEGRTSSSRSSTRRAKLSPIRIYPPKVGLSTFSENQIKESSKSTSRFTVRNTSHPTISLANLRYPVRTNTVHNAGQRPLGSSLSIRAGAASRLPISTRSGDRSLSSYTRHYLRSRVTPPPLTCSHCLTVLTFSASLKQQSEESSRRDEDLETQTLPEHIHSILLDPLRALNISGREIHRDLEHTESYFRNDVLPAVQELMEMHIRLGMRATSESSVLCKKASLVAIVETLHGILIHLHEFVSDLDESGIEGMMVVSGVTVESCCNVIGRVKLEIEKLLIVARSGVETLDWKERLVEAKERLKEVMDARPDAVGEAVKDVQKVEKVFGEKKRGLRERIRQRVRSKRSREFR